ncbi:MAG: tyrosine-type recombinase/integrase, partial [Thermoplasmatales archaeon]
MTLTEEQIELMLKSFEKFLRERLETRKPMDKKIISSELTVQSYMRLCKHVLTKYSQGVDTFDDISYPMTEDMVVKIILKMYREGYAYLTLYTMFSVFKNLFAAMGWKFERSWQSLGIREWVREVPYLTVEQMRELWEKVKNSDEVSVRDKALMAVVTLGLRPRDISNLKFENIDIQGDRIIITYTPCKRGVPGTTRMLSGDRAEAVIRWIQFLRERFEKYNKYVGTTKEEKKLYTVRKYIGVPDDTPLFPCRIASDRYSKIYSGYYAGREKKIKPISPFTIYTIVRSLCKRYINLSDRQVLRRHVDPYNFKGT